MLVIFFVILGHTDLRVGVSGTKFDAEPDFEVCLALAPPKPGHIWRKLIFRSKNSSTNFYLIWKNEMSGIV